MAPIDISTALAGLRSPNPAGYPELAGYSRDQIYDQTIGPGALYLAARMARGMRLQPGMVVLDLGCGRGASSMFLAQHYGVRVVAVDLWTAATDLYRRFSARGLDDRIVPLHLDASRPLPFADGYFDAIFSLNSFSFYGGSVAYVQRMAVLLKPGGAIGIGGEVLSEEFTAEQLRHPPRVFNFRMPPPNEHIDVFEDDFSKQHSPGWWRRLFEESGVFRVLDCGEAPDADVLNEDEVLFEHEHDIDPFNVAISLEQLAWNRDCTPRKTLFTLAARRAEPRRPPDPGSAG